MMRAERKKHEVMQRDISRIKAALFTNGGLQERTENFSTYYAKWGSGFIDALLEHSLTVQQKFTVLQESKF
jgi:uncharacterized protein YllA (UPF0747 family)